MLLTLPVNIPSEKTVMKMLHGLVVNNHNYNYFLPLVEFYVLKQWPFYDLSKIGAHPLQLEE